jgi:glycosyltransferase involved in cell wall biosynthesis
MLPLRVQLIAPSAVRQTITGISQFIKQLQHSIRAAGCEAWTTYPSPITLPWPINQSLKLAGLDLGSVSTLYPVRAGVEKADVYHLMFQSLAALLFVQRFPGPVVATALDIIPYLVRGDPELNYFTKRRQYWAYRLSLAGLQRAAAVVTISQYAKRTLVESLNLSEARVHVIPIAVGRAKFRPRMVPQAFYAKYHLDRHAQYILYVGTNDPRKNLRTLLQAFALVKRECDNVKLLKVGGPNSCQAHARLLILAAALGIQDDVTFLEAIPDDEIPLFYNVASVFTTASLHEGFGLPVLEAMACGTPTVCSNATALPEVAGEGALLVDPTDAAGLATALLHVLQDHCLRKRLAERGFIQAAHFTTSRMGQESLRVYQSVLQKPRA